MAKRLIEKISENFSGKPIKIFNPRRESFPDISDTVEVERQILWELDALNVADIIFFGILGNSKSPITLLELGMMMGKNCKRNQIIVFCPPEFYREQNVRLTLGHEIVAKDNAHLFDIFLKLNENYLQLLLQSLTNLLDNI